MASLQRMIHPKNMIKRSVERPKRERDFIFYKLSLHSPFDSRRANILWSSEPNAFDRTKINFSFRTLNRTDNCIHVKGESDQCLTIKKGVGIKAKIWLADILEMSDNLRNRAFFFSSYDKNDTI